MSDLRQQFDKQNLYDEIAELPKQFSHAFKKTDVKISNDTKKIVFCGVGGSALPANLLKTFLAVNNTSFNIPIKINRDYTLPTVVDKEWRGFFCSYSGNTEETLACLKEAEKKGLKEIVVLAHSGRLKEIAKEKGYAFVQIPETKQPRMAYGFVVGALLKILANSNLLKLNFAELDQDIEKSLALKTDLEKQGQALAESLKEKTPIVYCSNIWKYVGMIWKINFNENAKIPAFWNAFPEMNHNELVGFTNPTDDFKALVLKDSNDHSLIQKRMDVFKQVLGDKLEIEIINFQEGSPFFKMTTSLWLGLWTSYSLALMNEVDPTPVKLVEDFKQLLRQ